MTQSLAESCGTCRSSLSCKRERVRIPARALLPYQTLPANVCQIADKNFELLKSDLLHPWLHFKQIGELCRQLRSLSRSNCMNLRDGRDLAILRNELEGGCADRVDP